MWAIILELISFVTSIFVTFLLISCNWIDLALAPFRALIWFDSFQPTVIAYRHTRTQRHTHLLLGPTFTISLGKELTMRKKVASHQLCLLPHESQLASWSGYDGVRRVRRGRRWRASSQFECFSPTWRIPLVIFSFKKEFRFIDCLSAHHYNNSGWLNTELKPTQKKCLRMDD